MTFAWPWAFMALAPLILFAILHWIGQRHRSIAFSALHHMQRGQRSIRQQLLWLPPTLYLLCAAAVIFALARPQKEREEIREVHEGIAIMMLIDISSSMDMNTGFSGSRETRLEAAKHVLEGFVAGDGDQLSGRPHDLVGIVSFARYADTVCPLTLSHEAVTYITREIQVQDRPNEDGTAYGDAAALASAHLKMYEELQHDAQGKSIIPEIKSKIIVLLTDGENNCGTHLPTQAAAMAREWGIRIYTINFGEQLSPSKTGGNVSASDLMSPTEKTLREMAEMTGGIYRQATDSDSLRAVYAEIDQLEKSDLKPIAYTQKEEAFAPFALSALALLCGSILLNTTVLRRVP